MGVINVWIVHQYNPIEAQEQVLVKEISLIKPNLLWGGSLLLPKLYIPSTTNTDYSKVAIINTSWLEAHFRVYRLFMKEKFDVYLPFKKKLICLLVTHVSTHFWGIFYFECSKIIEKSTLNCIYSNFQ